MAWVSLEDLEGYMDGVLAALGMEKPYREEVVETFLFNSHRQMGHHDIYDFPSQAAPLLSGKITANPEMKLLASFGCQERWDGGNGMGMVVCAHAMRRAIALAKEYGMGLCAVRNSNHYLTSSRYTAMAAEENCVGLIIAKGPPSMGLPGHRGNVVGQSPNGFAFPTAENGPVSLDGCLAYVSMHGVLEQAVEEGKKVPSWWGADADGNPTDDPEKLLKGGTRYAIGEHKGFGYALLCELLAGVLSGGPILDAKVTPDGLTNTTSHVAVAIRGDALMSAEEFQKSGSELVRRVTDRTPGIRIPGQSSAQKRAETLGKGGLEVKDALVGELNAFALRCGAAARL